jgi:hypothetical protein
MASGFEAERGTAGPQSLQIEFGDEGSRAAVAAQHAAYLEATAAVRMPSVEACSVSSAYNAIASS